MGETSGRLKDTWRTLGPRGQLGVAASGLLVLVTLFFLFQMAGKASYTTLTSGLQASESAQVASALDSAGIKYQLKNGGTEIAVLSGSASKARLALASKNLPNGGHVGFELFDKSRLGQTDFQQKVQYQRALEGEIARTVEQIEGVRTVDVQLVIPDDALFLANATKATASVLVAGGSNLDGSTISGIAHLVSSSVKGLNADSVTITDETGTMLWPRSGGAGGAGPQAKLEAEQRYSSQLSSQINAMLVTTLGANKAQVRIHADLNVDEATLDKVTYAKKGTPLTAKSDQELLKSKGSSAATPAGTASNIPAYAAAPAGQNADSNYTHITSTTDFGVDKTVSHTVIAAGAVNRLNVALMVDTSIPAAQVAALQKSVAAMAGVDTTRGDTLAVTTLAFVVPPKVVVAAPAGGLPIPPAMLGMLKWVAVVLGSGIFLFFLRKNLKRREGEGVSLEPTWLSEIERSVPVGALGPGPIAPLEIAIDPEGERRHQLKEQVQDIVRTNPEQIALQINQWMREG
jgi:flagellar M-ring protein FliF